MTDDVLDPIAEAFRASDPPPTHQGITRRIFAHRTSTWLLAGGATAFLAACGGAAASKENVAALRKEIAAIKGEGAKAATKVDPKTADAHGAPSGAAPAAKHWEYEGTAGPENWAGLAPENAVCGAGSTQSPIDIASTQPGAGGRTSIKWQPAALTVLNNGHTIQSDVANGGAIEVDGTSYTLA